MSQGNIFYLGQRSVKVNPWDVKDRSGTVGSDAVGSICVAVLALGQTHRGLILIPFTHSTKIPLDKG